MRTIKVYKTNVMTFECTGNFKGYYKDSSKIDPSFDLEDCDNVLRIEGSSGVDRSKIEKNH